MDNKHIPHVSGVYYIRCNANNKYYIGSSKDIHTRTNTHISKLHKRKHDNYKMQEDYDKYGDENFEVNILDKCPVSEARMKEQNFIDMLNAVRDGYNCISTKESNECKQSSFLNRLNELMQNIEYKHGAVYCFNAYDFCKFVGKNVSQMLNHIGIDRNTDHTKVFPMYETFRKTWVIGFDYEDDELIILISPYKNDEVKDIIRCTIINGYANEEGSIYDY